MRILVTGGAGFIGRHVVKSFLKDHAVTIFDNFSNSSRDKILSLEERGVKVVKGDITNQNEIDNATRDTDVVIHLAAKISVSESVKNPSETFRVNVDGTRDVLAACEKNHIKKLVVASSAAVYGNSIEMSITEKSLTNPISPYGRSKLSAENIIKKTCEENDLRYVILRMFNVYGKGQNRNYSGVITRFLRNAVENKPLVIYGDGEQTRDFISIHDVVRAFDSAIKYEKSGTYNIASGKSLSINELARHVLSSLEKKLEIIHSEKQKDGIQNSQADITLAKKELGFMPTDLLKAELSSIYHELD